MWDAAKQSRFNALRAAQRHRTLMTGGGAELSALTQERAVLAEVSLHAVTQRICTSNSHGEPFIRQEDEGRLMCLPGGIGNALRAAALRLRSLTLISTARYNRKQITQYRGDRMQHE
jgi:hypothetical protein